MIIAIFMGKAKRNVGAYIELGSHGIRVNTLLPGIVEGPRIELVIADRAA